VEASDEVARKYYEETLDDERSSSGVIAAMRVVAKSKHQSFKGQFSKCTAFANPKLGDEFLQEVSVSYFHSCQFFFKYNWTMINHLSLSYKSPNIGTTMESLRCH
jgi:hypothetical protein